MCCFVVYVVIGIRNSVLVPRNFPPLIDFYVYLSMAYTLVSIVWFVVNNYWRSKGAMPGFLQKFAEMSVECWVNMCGIMSGEVKEKVDSVPMSLLATENSKDLNKDDQNAQKESEMTYVNLVDVVNRYVAFLFLLLLIGTQVAFWVCLVHRSS